LEIYNQKILIVDEDFTLLQLLKTRLTILGYETILASTGKDALISFRKEQPDLVILDIILPKLDGYEVCRTIRLDSQVPIIILTTLSSLSNRITGLELGADDYITKPFSPSELEARIKSVLRRYNFQKSLSPPKKKKIQISNLSIDMNDRVISKTNSKIKLTSIEYNLLRLLIENAGEKLSRTTILNNVWGYTPERSVDSRIVDVHISRLRSKIEEDPSNPDLILTIRGTGYMFQKCN